MTEAIEPIKESQPTEESQSTEEGQSSEEGQSNLPCDAEHLRVMVSDFEAQLESVADLVARVRHEINNPLTGVLGQAQLLLREDLNEKARKRVETIENLAMRLRDIVGQLRQVQRPTGELKVEKTHQEAKPPVENAAQ
ncbi:MAG TPA: histidine kinase dimerization/phospho-acceptor domain-containing protein [Pyrinomonadaceae bacterium]|nr:histidine kinase dimerization/phospho-acceptor domain-containing protein [Pyrinomonadaceae bacterium]